MQLKRKADNWNGSSGKKDTGAPSEKRLKMSQRERSLYQEDNAAELPHGKYVGRTLGWVKANDDWYYSWLWDNDLILSWGLCQLKGEPVKKKYNNFLSSDGEYWVELIEKQEQCTPADKSWYE